MSQPVKSEEPPMHSLTPTPSKPTTPTPAGTTPTAPAPTAAGYWAIDPVLQAQSAQSGQTPTGTYQYSYYPGYYQYHQPAQSASGTPTPTATATTAPTTAPQTSTANTPTVNTNAAGSSNTNTTNTADSNDIATLNDALGSAGVDLRAEEESLQRTGDPSSGYRSHLSYNTSNQDRTRKQPPTPSFNTAFLGSTMRNIATTHKITRVPEDSINYTALALRARLGDLVTNMVKAVKHRTDAQFDRPATSYPIPPIDPTKGGVIISEDGSQEKVDNSTSTPEAVPMWGIIIRNDVAKQLAAIEKVEREEETRVRKERKERADLAASHAAALAAQAAGNNPAGASGDGEDGEAPKKKRKKDGPGVTARNMSEDVRKKMSNAVASQAAGIGGRYAWMTAANANAPPPPKKPQPAVTSSTSTTNPNTSTQNASPSTTWGKPYTVTTTKKSDSQVEEDTRVSITMRDAMFVISTERGHGGGRGSARGWT
ncbi:hypothetical protein L218DRAFT_895123 [Marasmius fiardii PR-910]|nr:hypothetical protein L218DRAFT_895123 [Marasmius fiardii PR-910]